MGHVSVQDHDFSLHAVACLQLGGIRTMRHPSVDSTCVAQTAAMTVFGPIERFFWVQETSGSTALSTCLVLPYASPALGRGSP